MFVVVETLISHHSDRDDPILENIELSDPHNGHRSAENNVQEYQGGRCNCYMLSAAVTLTMAIGQQRTMSRSIREGDVIAICCLQLSWPHWVEYCLDMT